MKKMKRSIFLSGVILSVIVFSIIPVNALQDPFPLDGYVLYPNGEPVGVGANVTFTNQRTGEIIYDLTSASGWYSDDAGNFPSGYLDNDNITYYTTYNSYTNTTYYVLVVDDFHNTMNITLVEEVPGNASVTVTDGSISFGNLQLTEVADTEGVDEQTVNTTGAGGAQLIEIKLNSSTVVGDTNGTSLTFVSGSPGANQLRCQFKGGDVDTYTALTTSYQTYDDSMAANTTSALNIQLTMPSSVGSASYYDDYQFEVIVRATLL